MKNKSMLSIISLLLLSYPLFLHPEKNDFLEKYSYKIEHWLDTFFKDHDLNKKKLPSSDDMMEKMQQGLKKTIDFSKTTPQKLKKFMNERNQKVINSHQWIQNNYQNLKTTIETFFAQHPQASLNELYDYLNNSNNPVCRSLQKMLHKSSTAPWIINNAINTMIAKIKHDKK